LRGRVAVLATVIVALLAAGTWVALTHASAQPSRSGQRSGTDAASGHQARTGRAPTRPLQVISVTPARGASRVNGAAPVRVVFSAALAVDSPLPRLSPAIAGSWQRLAGDAIQFVPAHGFKPLTSVRLRIPAGSGGVRSAGGGQLAAKVTVRFRTGNFRAGRMDELLAQLGYLPMTWTPASPAGAVPQTNRTAQLSAAYSPPAGSFSWKSGYPSELRTFWQHGSHSGLIFKGAVMAFESDHGLPLDGIAGPAVWRAMFKAVAADQANKRGYTYARASEKSPETLTIWHNGHVVLRTLANTGIPVAPTTIGTAPVYLKYRFQIMKGTNPDGSKYADPVSFVSYFRAGEAVHYFPRGSYGFEQSLGCVEVPIGPAEKAYPYLTFGSLVTVAPPT
jgi:hypothetical protein